MMRRLAYAGFLLAFWSVPVAAQEAQTPSELPVMPPIQAENTVMVAPGVALPALSALQVTRERPLFSPGRRPPPPPPVIAEAEPLKEEPAAAAPPEPPPFELAGVVVGGEMGFAMLRNTSTQAVQRARQGETFDGWTLSEISQRYVVLQQEDRSVRLALFEVKEGDAARRQAAQARRGQESEDAEEDEDEEQRPQRRVSPRRLQQNGPPR